MPSMREIGIKLGYFIGQVFDWLTIKRVSVLIVILIILFLALGACSIGGNKPHRLNIKVDCPPETKTAPTLIPEVLLT